MLKHEFQDGGKLSVYDFQLYDEYDGEKSPFLAIAVYRPSPDDGFKVLGCEVTESDMQRTKFFHGMVEQVVAPPKDEKRMVVNVSLDTSGIDFGRVTKNAMRLVQLEQENAALRREIENYRERMIKEQDHRVAAITQRDKVIAGLEGEKEQRIECLRQAQEEIEALKRQATDLRGRNESGRASDEAIRAFMRECHEQLWPGLNCTWRAPGEALEHLTEQIKMFRTEINRRGDIAAENMALKRQAVDLRDRNDNGSREYKELDAKHQDYRQTMRGLLNGFWALVYPETPTSWRYPGEVLNHVRELIKEVKAERDAARTQVGEYYNEVKHMLNLRDEAFKERDFWKESAVKNAEQLTDALRRLHPFPEPITPNDLAQRGWDVVVTPIGNEGKRYAAINKAKTLQVDFSRSNALDWVLLTLDGIAVRIPNCRDMVALEQAEALFKKETPVNG